MEANPSSIAASFDIRNIQGHLLGIYIVISFHSFVRTLNNRWNVPFFFTQPASNMSPIDLACASYIMSNRTRQPASGCLRVHTLDA